MDIINFLGTLGLGAVLSKVVDVVLLQPQQEAAARKAWLRDKRLEAFATVSKEFLSFGLQNRGYLRSPFEIYASIALALLLIEDKALVTRIDEFVVKLDNMNSLTDSTDPSENAKADNVYQELVDEGREVIDALRRLTLRRFD